MSNDDHLVSVIMSVFNGGKLLPNTLESVRAQDYPNLELIVVNDGSTDESGEVLDGFSNYWSGPMKVLTHPDGQNRGIAPSYRLGLEHCQGKYIAFLEQDDVWPTNKISEQIKAFDMFPEVGTVFSDVYLCDEEGSVASKAFKPLINRPPTDRPFNAFWRLLWGNCVSTFSNTMIRHNQIKISDIITSPAGFQDWMLLLLLSSRCRFYHCSRTKIFWRQRQNSYHAKLRRLPNYRRLRKFALRNAIEKIWRENGSSYSSHPYKERLLKGCWYSVISIFNNVERTADYLNRKVRNTQITTPTHSTSLEDMFVKKGLQTQIGYK